MSVEHPQIITGLISLCKKQNVRCIVHVGAENGEEISRIRRASGGKVRAIGIDADPKCVPVPNIEFHRAMIGARNGHEAFYLNSSGLSSAIQRHQNTGESKVMLHQRRLDTFCRENDISPDALIVDTEGTTIDVLLGAGDILDTLKLAYLEVALDNSRGLRANAKMVDLIMTAVGMKQYTPLPAYNSGNQGNRVYIREA